MAGKPSNAVRLALPSAPSLILENNWRAQGFTAIAGVDEAGRGAWAGPVAAGAVILPAESPTLLQALTGIRDSKQLSPAARTRLAEVVRKLAVSYAVGSATAQEVDTLGLLPATRLAMQRALQALSPAADCLLVDAVPLQAQTGLPGQSLYFGESHSLSIAAASILAKVARDAEMCALAKIYPNYGFDRHKGYGTAEHQRALLVHGVCPAHRRTYRPIAALLYPPAEQLSLSPHATYVSS